MNVNLGVYLDRKNVANKTYKYTPKFAADITPFGEFSLKNAVFVLENYLDVNYGYFEYSGHTYYGYVDVSTRTNGEWLYSFTIDGLTTAYKAGCFNTNVFVEYGDIVQIDGIGNKLDINWQLDPREPINPVRRHEFYQIASPNREYYIAMVVSYGASDIAGTPPISSSTTPGSTVYFFSGRAYQEFIIKFFELYGNKASEIQNAYLSCIQKTYVIPRNLVDINNTISVGSVELGGIISNVFGLDTAPRIISVTVESGCYELKQNVSGAVEAQRIVDFNRTFNAITQKGVINMHCEYVGNLSFSPATYGIKSISRLGMKITCDYIGGQCSFQPIMNAGATLYNTIIDRTLECKTGFPEIVPGINENGQNFYRQLASFAFGSAGGISSSLSGSGQGSKFGDVAAVGSMLGGIGNAFVGFTANTFNATEGVTGGSIDRPRYQGSYFYFDYNDFLDHSNFVALYGQPVGRMYNISSSDFNHVDRHGYCQTRNCNLHLNGLPRFVVDEANAMLDSGCYIGLANMP